MTKRYLLLSLKEKFLHLIVEGKKTWEYRKVSPKKEVHGIIFYCPEIKDFCSYHAPIETRIASVDYIIKNCLDQGLKAESLQRYYGSHESGVAFKLKNVNVLPLGTKAMLEKLTNKKFIGPQGFKYIEEGDPLLQILHL